MDKKKYNNTAGGLVSAASGFVGGSATRPAQPTAELNAAYMPKSGPAGSTAAAAAQAVAQRQQQGTRRPGVSRQTQQTLAGYEGGYTPGAGVTAAQQYLDQLLGQKPGAYQSPYGAQLEELYGKITGRQPFRYDLNADALYRQYRDQYAQMGRSAMMDTMGQAAGLTGGYGSSYSQAAGQQAYDAYLQQLNDKVPELYNLALSKYQAEGDDLLQQYSLLGDREDQAYSRWRDELGDWRSDVAQAYQRYGDERDFDAGQWNTMLNYWMQKADQENDDWWQQTQWDYQLGRDQIADQRYDTEWQHQLDREGVEDQRYATEWQHQLDREKVSDSQWERQFAASQAAKAYQQQYSDLLDEYKELQAAQEEEQQDYYFKTPIRIHGIPLESLRQVTDYIDKESGSWSYAEWESIRKELAQYGIDIGNYKGKK